MPQKIGLKWGICQRSWDLCSRLSLPHH